MIYINQNTAINFRHLTVDAQYTAGNREVDILPSRVTECEIVSVEGENIVEILASGESRCHPFDNFNKEVGRKNSLGRAVKTLDRDFRKQIWTAYFNR